MFGTEEKLSTEFGLIDFFIPPFETNGPTVCEITSQAASCAAEKSASLGPGTLESHGAGSCTPMSVI